VAAVDDSFFSQADAITTYLALARRCETLFVAAGRAAAHDVGLHRKQLLATVSRHLGTHARAWHDLVPESVLLEELRARAPGATAVGETADDVVVALAELRDELGLLLDRTSPVADAAARRLARIVLADLAPVLDSVPGEQRRVSSGRSPQAETAVTSLS
jgi:hypothetical protein